MFEGAFSPIHILIVGIVALLVLGPDKLPDAARTAGKAWREVQKLRTELDGHVRDFVDEAVPNEFRPGAAANPELNRPLVAELPLSAPVSGEPAPSTDSGGPLGAVAPPGSVPPLAP